MGSIFASNSSGTATATPPTVQRLTSTGTTTGYLFVISTSTTCAVGDTYTNNGQTFTVIYALTAQTGAVLYTTGAGAPTGTGTLTRATGVGTASVTFTGIAALATYTTPALVNYLRVMACSAGGGGGGSASAGATAGGGGGTVTFGQINITGGQPGGAATSSAPGLGGTGGTINVTIGRVVVSCNGGDGSNGTTTITPTYSPGVGGVSYFGGAGSAAGSGTANNARANSGSGGGGGQGGGGMGGGCGGAGSYVETIITTPAATYPYLIGAAGTAGTGTSAGGTGSAGIVIVEEYY